MTIILRCSAVNDLRLVQGLRTELEKSALRPDVLNHFASLLMNSLDTVIERHIKDAIVKSVAPIYSRQISLMREEILRETRSELVSTRESVAWQIQAIRSHEVGDWKTFFL